MVTVANLAVEVADLALRLHRRMRQEDRVHGITGARLAVLERLITGGPVSLTELAGAEGVSAATMTRLIDSLEKGKLVLRERSASPDGRVVRVVPTALGRTLVAGYQRRRLRWLESYLGGLSEAERATVGQGLEILSRATGDRSPTR